MSYEHTSYGRYEDDTTSERAKGYSGCSIDPGGVLDSGGKS